MSINFEAWAEYVATLQDKMGVKDWSLIIEHEPAGGHNSAAEIKCLDGRKKAYIYLAANWNDDSPEDQRHYLVHELIHCHTQTVRAMVEDDLKGVLSNQAHEVLLWPFRRQLEYAVDGIADVIAPFMPLPDIKAESEDAA